MNLNLQVDLVEM